MRTIKEDILPSTAATFLFFTFLRIGELLGLLGPNNPNIELLVSWLIFFPVFFFVWRFILKTKTGTS